MRPQDHEIELEPGPPPEEDRCPVCTKFECVCPLDNPEPIDQTHNETDEPLKKAHGGSLIRAAELAESEDQFIGIIQNSALNAEIRGCDLRVDHGLLTRINDWADLPENKQRFKDTGWFGVASEFWKEHHGI